MSSSTNSKALIYDTLKTLNTPTEDSENDYFNQDYSPDFSGWFGLSEQDVEDVYNEIGQGKQESEKEAKVNQTESSTASDEENDGILSKVMKYIIKF